MGWNETLLYGLSRGSLRQHGSQVDDRQFDNLWLFFALFDRHRHAHQLEADLHVLKLQNITHQYAFV